MAYGSQKVEVSDNKNIKEAILKILDASKLSDKDRLKKIRAIVTRNEEDPIS